MMIYVLLVLKKIKFHITIFVFCVSGPSFLFFFFRGGTLADIYQTIFNVHLQTKPYKKRGKIQLVGCNEKK